MMNLKDILAISGEGTLFKFIAQGKNAIIVENLETGKRFSAGGSARVSALDEISLYTTGEDMPLGKVMDLIWEKEGGGEAPPHKQPDEVLREYLAGVLPGYDRERVYASDIRKLLHWYNILHRLNLLIRDEEGSEGDSEAAEAAGHPVADTGPGHLAGDSADESADKGTKGSSDE